MNLNVNRRLEYFEISDDAKLMGYFVDFFDGWFKTESTGVSFEYDTQYHTEELDRFGCDDTEMTGFDINQGFSDIGDFKW